MLSTSEKTEILRRAAHSPTSCQGGNSRVTRVELGESTFAVKDYSAREDGLQRQQRETSALTFLRGQLDEHFPEPLGVSRNGLRAIHSWIHGSHPEMNDATLTQMINIQLALLTLSKKEISLRVGSATDQVLDLSQLQMQIDSRAIDLQAQSPEIRDIVLGRLIPVRDSLAPWVPSGTAPKLILSPSDFGTHNLLWDGEMRIMRCIDLEFFGWDDAHKLTCDTLLHPQALWSEGTATRFLDEAIELYDLSEVRLLWLWPMLSLKWATIHLSRAARKMRLGDHGGIQESLAAAHLRIDQAQYSARDRKTMVDQVLAIRSRGIT